MNEKHKVDLHLTSNQKISIGYVPELVPITCIDLLILSTASDGFLDKSAVMKRYAFSKSVWDRRPDDISKSIQVIGTNSGTYPIDIFWFVFYERQIEVDIQTGSLIA